MTKKAAAPPLTDLQAAIVDYVATQGSRSLDEIAKELSSPGQVITASDIREWMARVDRPSQPIDPLAREHDEDRRAAITEEMYMRAAETVPGASAILGLERFVREAEEPTETISADASTIVVKLLDFLVPEIASARWEITDSSIYLPAGHRVEQWGPPQRRGRNSGDPLVIATTLAIFGPCGRLVRIMHRTRIRGKAFASRKGNGTITAVCTARLVTHADLDAIAQRVLQTAMEFRPGRHEEMSQKDLAAIVGRTKQALSHQMGLIADKVIEATGGRAGFRRRRNVRNSKRTNTSKSWTLQNAR